MLREYDREGNQSKCTSMLINSSKNILYDILLLGFIFKIMLLESKEF